MNYIKQIIFTFVIILLMIVALVAQIDINEYNKEKQALEEEYNKIEHENEKLANELEMPMDDEYIAKIAEEELGYKDPDKQYFYNDIPE